MLWKLTLQMGRVNQTKYVSNFNVQANHLGILVKLQSYEDQMEPMTTFLTNPQVVLMLLDREPRFRKQSKETLTIQP